MYKEMYLDKTKVIDQYKLFCKQSQKNIQSDKKVVINVKSVNKQSIINCTAQRITKNMDKERETISEFENFKGDEKYQREIIGTLQGCPAEEIDCIELEDFGHTYKKPQGVLKLNILN